MTALILEFALGMGLNLFVNITRHHPGAGASNYFSGSAQSVGWGLTQGPALLIIHVLLGLLLFVNAVFILVRSLRFDSAIWLPAALGFIAVVAAGFNGASFLDYNQDVNSFLMSIGFAVASAAYVWMLFVLPAPSNRP